MTVADRLAKLQQLLARVQQRATQPRPRVVVDGPGGPKGVHADLAAQVAADAGEDEPVVLEELDVVEELAPDSRTENVVEQPPTEEETPISERRPKSDLPAAEVTLQDLEREAEPGVEADILAGGPTTEQLGSTVDLPRGRRSRCPARARSSGGRARRGRERTRGGSACQRVCWRLRRLAHGSARRRRRLAAVGRIDVPA